MDDWRVLVRFWVGWKRGLLRMKRLNLGDWWTEACCASDCTPDRRLGEDQAWMVMKRTSARTWSASPATNMRVLCVPS